VVLRNSIDRVKLHCERTLPPHFAGESGKDRLVGWISTTDTVKGCMSLRVDLVFVLCAATVTLAMAQGQDGLQAFQRQCSGCHGTDGNGGEHGPSIIVRLQGSTEQELTEFLKVGAPVRGMPAFSSLPAAEMNTLVTSLRAMVRTRPQMRMKAETTDGRILEGTTIGQTARELQLRTDDERIHLLRRRQVSRSYVANRLD
jgi:mono/diheme cytochrome c family protein